MPKTTPPKATGLDYQDGLDYFKTDDLLQAVKVISESKLEAGKVLEIAEQHGLAAEPTALHAAREVIDQLIKAKDKED